MCWTCYANNLKAYKADINVYKVVKNASKKLCVSEFTGFTYYKDTEPSELKLTLHSNSHSSFLTIKEGYYSYESVNFVLYAIQIFMDLYVKLQFQELIKSYLV